MWDLHVTLCGWQYSRLGTNIKIAVTIFKHTFSVNLFSIHKQRRKNTAALNSYQVFRIFSGGEGGCLFEVSAYSKLGFFFNKYGPYLHVCMVRY